MKKVLLAGTALLGLALTSAPAAAELNLDLGGHFRGYGAFTDVDTAGSQDFEMRRDTEVHFTGEATSDNGLTVGVHYEAMVGGTIETDEAYAYFAGNWGRFNVGSEDGAAYLLQVAAPSGDSNVDGLRTNIQTITATGLTAAGGTPFIADASYTGGLGAQVGTTVANTDRVLDYDHADFQDTDRLTYLTPKFSGFQGGVSFAPQSGQLLTGNGTAGTALDATEAYENLWEAAARWDGEFEGFGLSAGAGYSTAEAVSGGTASIDGDINTWNAGLNVAFQGFSVGGAYLSTEAEDTGGDTEGDTWVVGAAWDNGPYHVGATYLDQEVEQGAATTDADRWAIGAGYTYGPGMSFRGGVTMGEVDDTTGTDDDFTQVTVGTDIQF